jgi:hypothetical protein
MATNLASCLPPTPSTIDPSVITFVEGYSPALLSAAQATVALPVMRELVLACRPVSIDDARTMLATASRFVADVAPIGPFDPWRFFSEEVIIAWAYRQQRSGMPTQTLSNHLQRLRRFLRVQRGLPARMRLAPSPRRDADLVDRMVLEPLLLDAPARVVAAYVAAIGAGRIASEAAGATVRAAASVLSMPEGDVPIVGSLSDLAARVDGQVVIAADWGALRLFAASHDVRVDRYRARITHSLLVLEQGGPAADLVRANGITRRMIDDVRVLLAPVDPDRAAELLRDGGAMSPAGTVGVAEAGEDGDHDGVAGPAPTAGHVGPGLA